MPRSKNRNLAILTASLFVLVAFLSFRMDSSFTYPFTPFNELVFDVADTFSHKVSFQRPPGSEGGFRDFGGLLLGMRRLMADVGWVSVLQYYGSHETMEGVHEYGAGRYPGLKKLILRVVRLDPSFHFAYLYGAGSLAFNLNRPEEALEILKEGIRRNPTYWRLRLYLAAIIYKQKGRFDDMIALLEDAITYPDCPVMIKSILANIVKERGNYVRSLEIWIGIAEIERLDPWYADQAKNQIAWLSQKIGL